MNRWLNLKTLVLAALFLSVGVFAFRDVAESAKPLPIAAALFIPDNIALESPYAKLWPEAASEAGVQVYPVHGSQWIQSFARHGKTWEGVILPDTFHRKMVPAMRISLLQYVQSGGKLMVVYDAGTLESRDNYPVVQVELTLLVGLDYAMYNALR